MLEIMKHIDRDCPPDGYFRFVQSFRPFVSVIVTPDRDNGSYRPKFFQDAQGTNITRMNDERRFPKCGQGFRRIKP